VLLANQETLVGHLNFDPRKECRDDCYISLPTHIPAGHTWLLGSTLDHEVTDTDQYLYARFRQKWVELGTSQLSTINVTVQLDTNKVRGFLFPAQAQLFWPSLTRRAKVKFPLTQIGNVSMSEITIENPADVPVVVQVLPLSVYPNAQTLLDTIVPSLLPADIMSDLIIGAGDELDVNDTIGGSIEVFTLPDLLEPPITMPPSDSGTVLSLAALRAAAENILGMRPHRRTIALLMPARSKTAVHINFQPRDDVPRTTVIIIRNNLTIIDTIVVQGQGASGDLKFSNRKPGSQKPLTFEMTEKHLKSCDKRAYSSIRSIVPSFTVKRTFTARNSGQLPIYIHSMSIGNAGCEGYGFKIIDCVSFELLPNDSRKVDVVFVPDFTMSRIRQMLTLQTSIGPTPLNFTLQATIPPHMLSLCASTLPRPSWEPLLYYAAVLSMGFLLFCVGVAAYLEADRISVAEAHRRRAETACDKGRVFDLRPISRGSITCHAQSMTSYEADVRSGPSLGVTPVAGVSAVATTVLATRSQRPVCLSTDAVTANGHIPPPQLGLRISTTSDGQKNGDSFLSQLLRRLLGSRVVSTPSSPILRADATDSDSKPVVMAPVDRSSSPSRETVSGGGGGRRQRSVVGRMLSWFGTVSYGAITRLVHRLSSVIRQSVGNSRGSGEMALAGKPSRDSTAEETATGGGVVSSAVSVTTRNMESDMQTMSAPPPAKSEAKASSHVKRSEKTNSVAAAAMQPISGGTTAPSSEETHAKPVAHSSSAKHLKVRNAKKSNDLRRSRDKCPEAEKTTNIIDKDDSSSSTTETSSIEADEKNLNPRDLSEPAVPGRAKKSTTAGKGKHDQQAAAAKSASTGIEAVSDQQTPVTAAKGKGHHKKKTDSNTSKSATQVELPYTIKRGDSATVTKEPSSRPKQAASPPPFTNASTPGTNNGASGGTAACAGSGGSKKKVTKCKSSDGAMGQSDTGSREHVERDPIWDMPSAGGRPVVDLSDLAAQTDAFAKSHQLGSTAKDNSGVTNSNTGSIVGGSTNVMPLSSAAILSMTTVAVPPGRSSSYSSVVSSATMRAKSPDHSPAMMSVRYDAMVSSSPVSGAEQPALGRRSPGSSASIMASSTTSSRPLASSRPVAAVGATVRRSWTANYSGVTMPVSVSPDDSVISAGGIPAPTHCHAVQSPLIAPSAYIAQQQQSMMMSDSSDVMMLGMSASNSSSCFVAPPPSMLCSDDALLSGFAGVSPNMMYPMLLPTGGMSDACYGASGSSIIPEPQGTFMQRLQFERRRRLYEYQQRKRLESATEHGWPGFDTTVPEPVDSIWERTPSPLLWPPNSLTSFGSSVMTQQPLQSQQQQHCGSAVRPASTSDLWNSSPTMALGTSCSGNSSGSCGGVGGAVEWGGACSSASSYALWGDGSSGTESRPLAVGGERTSADDGLTAAPIFDPFNSLEMNKSIWNPNSTGGSSGMSGWASSSSPGSN
jgi:hypothetical protein